MRATLKIRGHSAVLTVIKDGKTRTLSFADVFNTTSERRYNLMAIIAASDELHALGRLHVITDCEYIVKMIKSSKLAQWEKMGWKFSSGRRIPNADLWARYIRSTLTKTVTIEHSLL